MKTGPPKEGSSQFAEIRRGHFRSSNLFRALRNNLKIPILAKFHTTFAASAKILTQWSAYATSASAALEKFHILNGFNGATHNVYRHLIENILDNSLYVSFLCLATGVFMRLSAKIAHIISGGGWISSSRIARPSEWKLIYEMYVDIFSGHRLISFPAFKYLSDKKLIYTYVVFKELAEVGRRDRCGFFVIHYLSKAGVDGLLSNSKDGRDFDSQDLLEGPEDATGIYVGAIGAKSLLEKGFVLTQLIYQTSAMPNLRLFGRPATADGKRIARKYGWHPLLDSEGNAMEVWEGFKPID